MPLEGTVAAWILSFVYRCGGSDGIVIQGECAPSSRFIPLPDAVPENGTPADSLTSMRQMGVRVKP
jgi:hypothetical protein